MNLNQVTLPALNVAESVSFYQRLGFELIVDSPHYARFACPDGEATFSVHVAESVAQEAGVSVYFECEELDALCAELQRRGFEFQQLPVDQDWLWREAWLADPAGNSVCLYWAGEYRLNPPWRVQGQSPD